MNEQILVTLVIPVFNSAQYLDRFFACLSKQKFTSFCCLFVYDVSSDDTLKVLNQKVVEFSCLSCRILKKAVKEGVGKARDFAIDSGLLSTKYVLFLDCDDAFSDSFLQKLVSKAEQTDSDIVMCGYHRINGKGGMVVSTEMVHNPDYIVKPLESCIMPYLNPAPWNKLIKASIIQDARFIHKGGSGEDMMFFAKVLPNCSAISFVNEPLYEYFINQGSASCLTNESSLQEAEIGYQEVRDFYFVHGARYLLFCPLLEAFVFLRVGIGETTRVCLAKRRRYHSTINETRKYLDHFFPGWRENHFLSFGNSVKCGIKALMVWRCKVLYECGLFSLFVYEYKVFKTLFHKDVKW
jgi:glycosyltransferase involved in cell wall biosynthesis